jgi:TRAP-type C4-dicarboxylate transport system permease small subunit
MEKLSNCIYKIAYGVSVFLFMVMTLSILLQIFCRYVLNSPLLWPEELAKSSVIWIAFIAGSNGVKKGVHVYFALIVDRFPQDIRIYISLFVMVSLFFFSGICLVAGIDLLVHTKGVSAALGISYFWPKLGMIVGFCFMLIHASQFLVSYISILLKKT